MAGINLVWGIPPELVDDDVIKILKKYNGKQEKTTSIHERFVWKVAGVTVKRFGEKLVVQGTENNESLNLVWELSKVEKLRLDRKNAEKFVKLFPAEQNAILCTECNRLSLLIEGEIKGLDIIFRKECGHKTDVRPPFFMCARRIMPDVNTLVSNNLSKYIELGFFNNFEVVLPNFVIHIVDLLGRKEKGGASREIHNLRQLEKAKKIFIFRYNDGFEMPSTREEFQKVEDDIILRIANLTNSILLTGDRNLKDKAVLEKRPTIYVHPKISRKVKIIKQTRVPQ